jgi:hypothetical protein
LDLSDQGVVHAQEEQVFLQYVVLMTLHLLLVILQQVLQK